MTISQYAAGELIGVHEYSPEGPFGTAGNTPLPNFKPGAVVRGDSEGIFVFVTLAIPASVTFNQGDFFCWDNSFNAGPTGEVIAASEYFPGTGVGTLFLGGGVATPVGFPNAGNIWSFTFPPGVYGVWMQRYGTSLVNLADLSTGATKTFPATTAVKGRMVMQAAAAATTFSGAPVGSICNCPLSRTFTATTTTGSAILTGVSTAKYLVKGMQLTGAGIPVVAAGQKGTFITDIQGSTVTMSNAATASASVTITALNSQTTGNVVSGSKVITNVPSIPGLYPNQVITGTGVVSLTIASITGVPGNYTINLVTAATATNNNVQITLAAPGTNFYFEGFLREPMFNVAL